MGQVTLQAVDESGNKLGGVTLSLSGDGGFRQNNKTSEDGSYTFAGLVPGEFHLRPMLKEYRFSPASMPISIEEGNNPTKTIKATRVAFRSLLVTIPPNPLPLSAFPKRAQTQARSTRSCAFARAAMYAHV